MENKTVRDWIESVEDVDVRIEIHQLLNKNNPKSVVHEILNTEYDCFSAALCDCFLFAGTPQGSEYWCDICLAEDLKIMSEEEILKNTRGRVSKKFGDNAVKDIENSGGISLDDLEDFLKFAEERRRVQESDAPTIEDWLGKIPTQTANLILKLMRKSFTTSIEELGLSIPVDEMLAEAMGKKFDNFEVMLKSVIHPVKCGLSVTETILLGTLMSLCSTYIKHTNHQDSKGIEELKHSINRITGELDR